MEKDTSTVVIIFLEATAKIAYFFFMSEDSCTISAEEVVKP